MAVADISGPLALPLRVDPGQSTSATPADGSPCAPLCQGKGRGQGECDGSRGKGRRRAHAASGAVGGQKGRPSGRTPATIPRSTGAWS